MTTNELRDKKALVTGATSGIGRAIAVKLAEAGATVYVTGRRAELGKETVELIEQAGGTGHFVVADVANIDDVRRLAEEVGEVDVLVNNAGIFPFSTTPEQSLDSYEQVFDINVRASYFLTAALAPAMVAKKKGAIVNVSSVAAQIGTPVGSVYNASKAAMDALTRSWAVEFGAAGVRVNSVAPGPIRTDTAVDTVGEMFEEFSQTTPLARAGEPEEIAEAVVFLASDKASYITGAVLTADGGLVAT
ncbi:NAD(P)-dependent dehydrogenase, short-chain alcohol dehydrogenase family [Streptomyces sp. Ag82_O1-12]|uniref:SDR family NAD(P)-dependent oxidoreductase n=1 Tax=unclassified Streptomyces TaxID=2593676 RepID=UPI000BD2A706|nr:MULTISPECIES: SDR family oxidoreductase [unclassified Streptomyces]SMQ17157.1 NAD(P)-dependent dehydrogenase, short-chain alcohol dehydrogenase family [Streptomyces sp. Ag82_O1-12]SOD46186.1 NAD(P)-dependent dehydrogenase, short-chain alcohol dehydrogenase family [Streptomyces sp. Ag82_G6-1]